MKLEVKGSILNIVTVYALQVSKSMEEKNDFLEDLDELIKSASKEEEIVLGADLNGHVGKGNIGDEEIMGRYDRRRRRRRLMGIHSRSDTNRTGAEGLSFYYPRLLHCLNQMLAVMSLSQHRVLSSKTVRPRAPCGARCTLQAKSLSPPLEFSKSG